MHLKIEKIPYGENFSFASTLFEGPKFLCPYHRHPECEIVAIDSGRGRLVAGDYTGSFRENDLFLLGANLPHIFRNSFLKAAPRSLAKSHVIQFRLDFAGQQFFELPEFRSIQRLLRSSRRGLKITGPIREKTRARMLAVENASGGRRVIELLLLLSDLSAARSLQPLAGTDYEASILQPDGRMTRVMSYIQENLTERLCVPEAARRAGLTPNAFCRYFKQRTRRTFVEMVNELRIEEACRILNESGASVTEACYASGFSNLSHFHAVFKRQTGCSPLKFRSLFADIPEA